MLKTRLILRVMTLLGVGDVIQNGLQDGRHLKFYKKFKFIEKMRNCKLNQQVLYDWANNKCSWKNRRKRYWIFLRPRLAFKGQPTSQSPKHATVFFCSLSRYLNALKNILVFLFSKKSKGLLGISHCVTPLTFKWRDRLHLWWLHF